MDQDHACKLVELQSLNWQRYSQEPRASLYSRRETMRALSLVSRSKARDRKLIVSLSDGPAVRPVVSSRRIPSSYSPFKRHLADS